MSPPTFGRTLRGNQRKTFHAGAGVELLGPNMHLSEDKVQIVDRVLDTCTIVQFLEFVAKGTLPGGNETAIPLFEIDDIKALLAPYKEWAPGSFKDITRSAIDRITASIGSYEESERLVVVGKDIQAMKVRAWIGLPPLSERRWEEEKLNDLAKFDQAIEYLGLLTDTFSYLNHPLVRRNLRGTYNRIWDHLKQFENARNAVRAAEGKEKINATGLWQDYIRAHHETMANRAHSWILAKLAPMRERVIREIKAYKPASEDVIDDHQMKLADQGHEISQTYLQADISILMPLDGYKGFGETRKVPDLLKTEGQSPIRMSDVRIERQQIYAERIKFLHNQKLFVAAVADWKPRPKGSPESLAQSSSLQSEAQDETRRELRGEPSATTAMDDWMRIIRPSEEAVKRLGFVAIRLWYSDTAEKWERFKQLFEADINNWGIEDRGSNSIKQKAIIHWVDGQELGIPKMDLDTARACFQSYVDGPDFPEGLRKDVFLAADAWSIASYIDSKPNDPNSRFIRAIDPHYDADDPSSRPDESPNYKGEMRVRGSVLWDDFFALLQTQAQNLEDLWPLAMDHPMQIYAGPVTNMQLDEWKEYNMLKNMMMTGFRDFLRQQTDIPPDFENMLDQNPMLRDP